MKTNFLAQASLEAFTKANLNDVISCENQEISDWAKTVASVFDSPNPKDQPDLLMMRSILVSEGMNLNDDIFLRQELMNARSTGAHKPVNLEHQDENIVGHMLKTYAVNKNGRIIEGDMLPNEPIDVINEAVVYSYIFPQLSRDIEDMASTNDLFVSVEAWFDSYDYAVGNKIIERNENTSPILDAVLRINGGEGTFRGNKVGRVLRNIRFGGVGIVATPANPESLILEVAETKNPESKSVESPEAVIASSIIGDIPEQEEIFCLTEQNSDVKEGNKMDKKTEKCCNNYENSSTLDAIFNVVDNVKSMLTSAEAELLNVDDQIVVLGQRSKVYARKQSLASLGLSVDQIINREERVIAMSDEQFNEYSEDLQDLVQANENSSEENGAEESSVSDSNTSEIDTVETEEVATEEAAEVVETEQPEAAVEVEAVEEVSPEAPEVAEVEVVEEVVSEDAAPEVVIEEEVAVEAPSVEVEVEAEVAPVVETVVEEEVTDEEVEVNLDSIEPLTPEISFPSADQDVNSFDKQIHDAIVDIFNQRKKR